MKSYLCAIMLCVGGSGTLCMADTTFDYTNAGDSFSIALTVTLSGASVQNLAAGTDVSGSLVSLVFTVPGLPPGSDTAGFALGVSNYTPQTIQIGTNALGQITSWNISDVLFASYPAFSGENPNDFFCNYTLSSTSTTDSSSLTTDHDAGFCPGNSFSGASDPAGFGATQSSTPEPASYLLLGGGLASVLALAVRRKRVSAR